MTKKTKTDPTKSNEHTSVLSELNRPADETVETNSDNGLADTAKGELANAREQTERKVTEKKVKARATAAKAKADMEDGIDRLQDKVSEARERGEAFYDDVRRDIEKAYSDGYEKGRIAYRRAAERTSSFIDDNPLAVGAIGLAAGVLIGALLPRTRVEDEKLGTYRDDVIDRAREKGTEFAREAGTQAEDMVERAANSIERTVKGASNGNDQSASY